MKHPTAHEDLGVSWVRDKLVGALCGLGHVVIFLTVVVFNMVTFFLCQTYSSRFEDFKRCAENGDDYDVDMWRKEQQDEWNRLSTVVGLI